MTEELLTKQGEVVVKLARHLLTATPGSRIPSVSEYCVLFNAGTGTVHAALRTLTHAGAIDLAYHGHQGTMVKEVNRLLLWKYSLNTIFYGCMPLPYTTRLQGLATAICDLFEKAEIPFSLAYVRGGRMRVKRLLEQRTDFIVCSRLTATLAAEEYPTLYRVMDFGYASYLTHSLLVFSDPNHSAIEDGMRVGVDESSYDHPKLVQVACRDRKVTFIPLSYNQVINKLREGKIDATVWSQDEIMEKYPGLNSVAAEETEEMRYITHESACAVLLVRKNLSQDAAILREVLEPERLLETQKEVLDGIKNPSY